MRIGLFTVQVHCQSIPLRTLKIKGKAKCVLNILEMTRALALQFSLYCPLPFLKTVKCIIYLKGRRKCLIKNNYKLNILLLKYLYQANIAISTEAFFSPFITLFLSLPNLTPVITLPSIVWLFCGFFCFYGFATYLCFPIQMQFCFICFWTLYE